MIGCGLCSGEAVEGHPGGLEGRGGEKAAHSEHRGRAQRAQPAYRCVLPLTRLALHYSFLATSYICTTGLSLSVDVRC